MGTVIASARGIGELAVDPACGQGLLLQDHSGIAHHIGQSAPAVAANKPEILPTGARSMATALVESGTVQEWA
jgi:hypothetical protein